MPFIKVTSTTLNTPKSHCLCGFWEFFFCLVNKNVLLVCYAVFMRSFLFCLSAIWKACHNRVLWLLGWIYPFPHHIGAYMPRMQLPHPCDFATKASLIFPAIPY